MIPVRTVTLFKVAVLWYRTFCCAASTLLTLCRQFSFERSLTYPDLGSASNWSCHVGNLIQPLSGTTQIWVVTRHQYGISTPVS